MLTRFRQITLTALSVTILMVSLTAAYWYNTQKQSKEKHQQFFNESANQAVNTISLRLSRFELMLRGVKGFYEGSKLVTKLEFREYIHALELKQTLPGFQAVAVVLHVPHQYKAEYNSDMKNRGFSNFLIKPLGNRQQYSPISLIEPFSQANQIAIGYDFNVNPAARSALFESGESGLMVMTSKLNLIQDAGKKVPAVVMYVPIYNVNMPIDTSAERRKAILGWVSGPFRINDFIASLEPRFYKDIGIEIFEGNNNFAKNKLYGDISNSGELHTKRSLHIGGKQWTIILRSKPSFDARFPKSEQIPIIAGGLMLSLLLGWLVWLLGSGRERAVQFAHSMNKELRQTKSDLECTLNAIPDLIFELDIEGNYYDSHTKNNSILAVSREQLIGKNLSDFLPRNAAETCMSALQEASMYGISSGKQIEIPLCNESRWFELSIAKKLDDLSTKQRFVMISRDITDRKIATNQLTVAAIAFETQMAMCVTDAENIILQVNNSYTTITGYSAIEAAGRPPSLISSGGQNKRFYESMWGSINQNGSWKGEIWNRRKSGEVFPCQLSITAVKDTNGMVTNYVATMIDITSSKAATDEIKMLAFYDPLTHLPNRRLLIDRLNQALASSARSGQKGALLFLDIDHFKNINDSLGHDVGDDFLKEVANRITKCVRIGDTVARIGGDEYVVLLEALGEELFDAATKAEVIAHKILQMLGSTYQLGDYQCHSTVSIGATLFDKHQIKIDELLKQADIAMYEAKNSGRNGLRFFDPKMQVAISTRAALERELRVAVEQQQFILHYQLQVDSAEHPLGAEILIRWEHPERGLISPLEFIPLAEETGLILTIGQWVLDCACIQLKIWEQNQLTKELKLSVNVSAKQFHQPNFVDQVKSTIVRHKINPLLLNLELTESMLVNDADITVISMNKLREAGVRFELDDFGTGYSSLQYLKKLPLYQLKIDRSFVRDITTDVNDRSLVITIINMAHSLGLKVIAEGVEMAEQLQFLKNNDCDHFQGYFFSQPVPIKQFEALVKKLKNV